MQRVYGVVEEELVHRIDEAAGEAKVSRAQWIRNAIESYLHHGGEDLFTETVNLREDAVKFRTAIGEKDLEISKLKETLAVRDGELVHLQSLKAKYDQAMNETSQRWEETKSLRSELSQLKKELEEIRSTNQKLRTSLAEKQAEAEHAKSETEIQKVKLESYKDTLKIKDDEISFLRAHIHQLSEKLPKALPEPEDEKRSRWKFWQRG